MKYGESAFDIFYLVTAVAAGCLILKKAKDRTGKMMGLAVLILGCGMISLFKMAGYGKIVAVDPRREALDHALAMGADEAYTPEEYGKANEAMETHPDGFVKGLIRFS